jgi:hypothetical protein
MNDSGLAVFWPCASPDAAAARRPCEALRAAVDYGVNRAPALDDASIAALPSPLS